MALVQATLKAQLEAAFKTLQADTATSSPKGTVISSSATLLAAAYHTYASLALVDAGFSQVTPATPSPMQAAMIGQPLDAGFESGMTAYWTPVTWTAPGFIPVNPTNPAGISGVASDLKSAFKDLTDGKASVSDAADRIATILHTYTQKVMVNTTTVPPASVPATLPLA